MKKIILSISLLHSLVLFAEGKMTKEEYVGKWSATAVEQMNLHGVPASVTLAQGVLESGFGNSYLAVKANNHFGIKCHNDWSGKKVYRDDDKKNECFRSYKSADESFEDHSLFLTKKSRYDFLFELDQYDYKEWCKGLKTAGYATNPKYPKMLITIIEELNLSQFDNPSYKINLPLVNTDNNSISSASSVQLSEDHHTVYTNDFGVQYVVCETGDTFLEIAAENSLTLSQLNKYNDFEDSKDVLVEGDVIYIRPKKKSKLFKHEKKRLNEDLTLIQISQKYGVDLASLKKLNSVSEDTTLYAKGSSIVLR